MQTGENVDLDTPGTNFTVARVQRDILSRSSIGAIATVRSDTADRLGAAATYGIDGSFSFKDEIDIDTFWAVVDNPGMDGNNTSYRTRFNYDVDLFGFTIDHMWVGDNFAPAVGFVRRNDMRRTFAQGNYNPRPTSIDAIRQFQFTAQMQYIENGAGVVEDLAFQGQAQIGFESGDNFGSQFRYGYELLPFDFEVSDGVLVPRGPYDGNRARIQYQFGQQRRVAGTAFVQHGAFYDGTSTQYGFTGGRVEVHHQLSIQPGVQFNQVKTPFGDFSTRLVSSRVIYTITPLMFISGLVQYNNSNNSLSSNVRMRWEYQPWSELFVVYNDGRTTEGDGFPALQNRSVVVKINRLFRF